MDDIPFYRRPVVLILAAVVFLGAGFAVWWGFFSGAPPALSSGQAQEIAKDFLTKVRSGKTDDAWKDTSSDFKSMWGQARFRELVKAKPALKSQAEFEACDFKTEGDLKIAECSFQPTGGKGKIIVTLHPDQGRWKIGRLAVE